MGSCLSILENLLVQYQGPRRQCFENENYDAMVLGGLIKELVAARLYPIPDPSNFDRSLKDVVSALRGMQVPSLCNTFNYKRSRHIYPSYGDSPRPCGIRDDVLKSISALEARICGLSI